MKMLETKRQHTAQRNYNSKRLVRAIAILLAPFYSLVTSTGSYAEIPLAAKIAQVTGLSELSIRTGSQYRPAERTSVLKRHIDTLNVPGSGRSSADLRFYAKFDKDLGLFVRAIMRNESTTLYYFPCTLQGDFIMEWAKQPGERACLQGLRVQNGLNLSSERPSLNHFYSFQGLKEILNAQAYGRRIQYHCVVLANSGRGWMAMKSSGNPCWEPLQQCLKETSNGECTTVTLDRWRTRNPDLTASVVCADNQVFTVKGTGSTLKEQVVQLWKQAEAEGATFCGLHILGANDVLVVPPKNERLMARTLDTGAGITVEVLDLQL